VNLGEVTLDHGNARVKAFTDLQSFGMIVTAEPYFAVSQPGNMVVMESAPTLATGTENIEARYELVTRGTYSSTNTHIQDAIFGSIARLRSSFSKPATLSASHTSPPLISTLPRSPRKPASS